MNETVYYYEIKKDETLSIVRVFGNNPIVEIPKMIDGKVVSEIGAYCFSKTNKVKNYNQSNGDISLLSECSGQNVEGVILPDTITKIDSYAFYNCRKCEEIHFGNPIFEVGSDVFLNCVSLHTIKISCLHNEMSALKLLLKQINWNVDVCFKDMILSFPEYYEIYDVIGPAHIFGVNISGEGYRARQCFKNNVFLIQEYDEIFEKLCIEESVKTLCHFALNRVLYPTELNESHFRKYEAYLKNHSYEASTSILQKETSNECKIDQLKVLVEKKIIDVDTISRLIELTSKKGMVEISTYLIQWKQQFYKIKNKYDFEEF